MERRASSQKALNQDGQLLRLVMVQHVARVLDDGYLRIGHLFEPFVVFGEGIFAFPPESDGSQRGEGGGAATTPP